MEVNLDNINDMMMMKRMIMMMMIIIGDSFDL